jgi:hypothetical protein
MVSEAMERALLGMEAEIFDPRAGGNWPPARWFLQVIETTGLLPILSDGNDANLAFNAYRWPQKPTF